MSLLGKLLGRESEEAESDDRACNVSGHDFQPKNGPHYHSKGVPHFGFGSYFTIEKKIPEECTKCGKYRQREKQIGKVSVDKETDELTILQ